MDLNAINCKLLQDTKTIRFLFKNDDETYRTENRDEHNTAEYERQ